MKKRLRNRIFAVIGVFALILPLFLVPVSADYSGIEWDIEKSNGVWVVKYKMATSTMRPFGIVYTPDGSAIRARGQEVGIPNYYQGFYLSSVSSLYESTWNALDIPLFSSTYSPNTPAHIDTSFIDLNGLPLGVEVTISLNVTGSFSNISDSDFFEAFSLYDLPLNQTLTFADSIRNGYLVPYFGTKLPLSYVTNPDGTGTIYSTSFTSTGSEKFNLAIHYERYAGYDYSRPMFVLPEFKFTFTTDQLEQLIASQKYNAGLTKQIADALKADPEVQREIQNKKEEQSRFEEELSQGLQDMSLPELSLDVPEVSIDYPEEAYHMMDFIYEIPGVIFLVSLVAGLWIVGLLLFGKREGSK